MMRPPQQSGPVELEAGQEVPLVLSYQPQAARGFGEANVTMVTFQLNAARQIDEEEYERAVQLASDADVADLLLGTTEPGGRLPTTWPASEEGLPSTQPVDGVLTYDEGLFIGYRAYDR